MQNIRMANDAPLLSRLHSCLIRGLIADGACPSQSALAQSLGLTPLEIESLLRGLAAIHGVVLHPHVCEPWIVHPFSLTPASHWIESRREGWWAPCVWCAFGVAALVGGDVRIHTRYGGQSEALAIPVSEGEPYGLDDVWVHFAIPPAHAWDNVHRHCALVLPFHSRDEIAAWCHRHRLPQGEAVPLPQVAHLAREWYGTHAHADWHKWTVAEAQAIFHRVGLRSDFWNLGAKSGEF
jgi:Alkylmercury lyase